MCKSNLQSASSPLYSHLRKHKHTHTNTPNTPRTLSHTQKQLCRYGVSKSIDYFFCFVCGHCGVVVLVFTFFTFCTKSTWTWTQTSLPNMQSHSLPLFMHKRRYQITHEKKSKCRGRHHACLPTHTLTHHNSPTQHRWTPFLNVPPPVQPLFLSHLTFRLLSSCCLLVELLSSFSCGIWASFFFFCSTDNQQRTVLMEPRTSELSLLSLLSSQFFCCLSMLYPGPMPDVSTSPGYFHSLYQRTALSWLLREAFYTCWTYFYTWIYPTNMIHSIVDMISFLFLQI